MCAFTSQTRIVKFTTPSPAAGRWKRVRRQASMSMILLAARVVGIGGSMVVTPDFGNLSQIGCFFCEHHDEDRVFEIFHAEYITMKHVKNALHPIRVGPKDGKGCDSRKSMTAVHRHCRKQSERLAEIRVLSADCKSPLKSMNFDIGMETNVVHVDENKENAVAEKAMNSSYIRLPHLINDLNITGLMITDKPLKSSPYRWLSWKSIRPRRRLASKLDELQQLIASQFVLGSRHISVPQRLVIASAYQLNCGKDANEPTYFCCGHVITAQAAPWTRAIHIGPPGRIVERTFGVWKRRFPCLDMTLQIKTTSVPIVITFWAALHNFGHLLIEPVPPPPQSPGIHGNGSAASTSSVPPPPPAMPPVPDTGFRMRERIVTRCFT
ncbi:hypothetical protein HPB52_025017 [Rhipicephalus sanguineus]|uniref:DDE Tnp4 domain-containing protein n=1 Tax=Rhipicephalus sanguineus TaxID=34632 RepID=A0A9D4PA74_RHISA|nr:hypothetical protein HPB52_025017 [Rhipicephalus sanguineus]